MTATAIGGIDEEVDDCVSDRDEVVAEAAAVCDGSPRWRAEDRRVSAQRLRSRDRDDSVTLGGSIESLARVKLGEEDNTLAATPRWPPAG
jgi:hypothetical protein